MGGMVVSKNNGLSQNRKGENLLRHIADLVIVGADPAFLKVIEEAERFALTPIHILIQGETGTGKEIIAKAIHYLSDRRGGPFVTFTCSPSLVDLLENELFGHLAGAYTNASGAQKGIVDQAEGGTLFLDEIHNLPPSGQEKLLRLLDTLEYRPLGGAPVRKANIRIVCACNIDLLAEVEAKRYKRDFYHRIKRAQLTLPPLRHRRCDIIALARYFLANVCRACGIGDKILAQAAEQALLAYNWPGNVRELHSIIESAAVLARGTEISASDLNLPPGISEPQVPPLDRAIKEGRLTLEREYLQEVLKIARGVVSVAANLAGRDLSSFYRLIRKHRIDLGLYRGSTPS